MDSILACRPTNAYVSRRRKEDEPLHPQLASLVALALQLRLERLRRKAVEFQRAGDGVRDVPVVVGALNSPAIRLDLDDEDGMRRDDDGVELENDATSLDEPRVAINGVVRRKPFHEKSKALSLRVVRGLTDRDEMSGHGHTSRIFAAGNQMASWSSTRKRPPLSGWSPTTKSKLR